MPKFALKYFIRRAPDFFDWRSGVFEFPADKDILEHENKQILDEEFHELYKLPSIDLDKKILVIKALLEEPKQEVDSRLNLQQRLGDLFLVKGCFQDACASYDKVLAINPEYAGTWGNRGISLGELGRLEEALASFDKVLAINPEDAHAWFNRGNALGKLGRLEEAVVSYAKALAINPEDARAWFNKACALALQNDVDSAIENLRKAIDLDSKCQQDAAVDPDFAQIRNHPRFRLLLAGESRPKTNSFSPDLEVNQSSSDGADGKTPSKNQDPEMGSQAEDGFIFRE
jgi:tetratricopeptide (TPR) repeat protein